jgi:hypothetical protein
MIGIPIGLYTGFKWDWQLYGLWLGLVCGQLAVSFVEIWVILRIDWKRQAENAKERLAIEAEETRALLDPTGDEEEGLIENEIDDE